MAMVHHTVRAVTNRLPKVISPRTHAIIDYANAGGFILMGALMMKRTKRAGLVSIFCGAMEAGNVMMTDMPLGLTPLYSQETHAKIDAAFSSFVAMAPTLLAFRDKMESILFRSEAVALAAVTGLTDFEGVNERSERRRRRAA